MVTETISTPVASTQPPDRVSARLRADSLLQDATLQVDKGDFEAAGRTLAKALSLVPEHPGCLACLAVCVAADQHKFITAEKLARRAIQLAPRRADSYCALGKIYLLGCRKKEAYKYLRRAHQLAPDNPRIKAQLDAARRQRMPLLRLLPDLHPVSNVVYRTVDFLLQERHLVLVAGMLLVALVWLGLGLYGRAIAQRVQKLEDAARHQAIVAGKLHNRGSQGESAQSWGRPLVYKTTETCTRLPAASVQN
jgi:tetratricopeptide (TPR) repeat protein